MKYRYGCIIFLLGCFMFSVVITEDLPACKTYKNDLPTHKLKQKLMCNYDWTDGPTRTYKENATKIKINFIPKYFEFDTTNLYTLKLHTWTAFSWRDPQLTWNKEDYGDITIFRIENYEIWVPEDVLSFNNIDMNEEQNAYSSAKCIVFPDGEVVWIPTVTYTAHCTADHTMWPYDTKNCTFSLMSWEYPANKILLESFNDNAPIMEDFAENMEWKLVNLTFRFGLEDMKLDTEFKSSVMYVELSLQNRSTSNDVHVLYTFVLMVLTLSIMWLEPNTLEQTLITSVSFICHFLCILNLGLTFGQIGSSVPNIVLFYERSMVITTFVLLATTLQREMLKQNSEAPKWMSDSAIYILRSKTGQLLILKTLNPQATYLLENASEENVDLVKFKKKESAWGILSIMFGWIFFVCIFFTYVVMLAVLIPTG